MRIFVTGASGWIGSAVVPELIGAGHDVLGLARSDASAEALAAAGAQVHRGDLGDIDSLRAGAAASDGVIHLAYNHDFSDIPGAARTDRDAVDAIGAELAGSDRPLVIASGLLGLGRPGSVASEQDRGDAASGHPRHATARATQDLAARGVRSCVLRLPPSVHGDGDEGFVPTLITAAREQATSGYVGDGANCWPAVHISDAASLFRLAVEQAPAGSVLHAAGDEGVATRRIAEAIGGQLDVPVVSVDPADALTHFGWIGMFFAMEGRASSTYTRELLGWQPTGVGLIADLEAGHYFRG
jgi:nucleoside-diphosphate-sugar epimerase